MIARKDKLWIFTFEYTGIAKVGGLGEVPANQARSLSEIYDISVFIPSHGQLHRLQKNSTFERLPFICVGQINPSLFEINDSESSYAIAFYKFKRGNINIYLLSGENAFTSKYLDDKVVYNPETLALKVCLYSIGMRNLIEFLIKEDRENLPDIVHLHDYHVVIPFIGIKQELFKNGLDITSIITIHLLTWPRYERSFFQACGVDDTPLRILTNKGLREMNLNEIFTACEEKVTLDEKYRLPTVEKIGAFICDMIITVSESYLKSDVLPNLGFELINYKSDFVWNGCDWDYDFILHQLLQSLGSEIKEILNLPIDSEITREKLKEYFLTYKIGNLHQSPLIISNKVLNAIHQISITNPYIKNGNIKVFSESGPLMITTGRISSQKGFETIFEAIPEVIKQIPNAKFLFMVLPTEYSINEIKLYSQYIMKYPDNLRIIFGLSSEIFYLAHIVADVYCAPSRWEPFGIMALEAMSSKLPIIATKIGGLQESILDLRRDPLNGTGLLIEKNNVIELAQALVDLFRLKEIYQYGPEKTLETFQNINLLSDAVIKSQVMINSNYYDKLRENCQNRVKNHFRWKIVSLKLAILYDKTKKSIKQYK